jgi:hypothetical protein
MSRPQVTYVPRLEDEGELSALVWVYRFVLDCHAKKEGARPGTPNDGTESKEDSADVPIIQD